MALGMDDDDVKKKNKGKPHAALPLCYMSSFTGEYNAVSPCYIMLQRTMLAVGYLVVSQM
jgi:hypothetical protein